MSSVTTSPDSQPEHDEAPEVEHPTPDELWSAITDLHRRLVLIESKLDVADALSAPATRPRGRRRPRHGAW